MPKKVENTCANSQWQVDIRSICDLNRQNSRYCLLANGNKAGKLACEKLGCECAFSPIVGSKVELVSAICPSPQPYSQGAKGM
jgi:hypothetical protein